MRKPSLPEQAPTEDADVSPRKAARGTIKQRLSVLTRRVRHFIWPGKKGGVVAPGTEPAGDTRNVASNVSDRGLISQINGLDHQHMQAFPADRKAQVMEKIMSLTPVANAVSQGNNKFEMAVMNLHREGYGLIDLQPLETVFTTVWYRKSRAFASKSADVTMLLWEDDENGASVTMMSWRI